MPKKMKEQPCTPKDYMGAIEQRLGTGEINSPFIARAVRDARMRNKDPSHKSIFDEFFGASASVKLKKGETAMHGNKKPAARSAGNRAPATLCRSQTEESINPSAELAGKARIRILKPLMLKKAF